MSNRRLPIYLVLDNSGSMTGDPIQAVNQGIQALVSDLQTDPFALETAYLSIIEFNSNARQIVPLTEIGSFKAPTLATKSTTSLGAALTLLTQSIQKEVKKPGLEEKGDWKPLVFIMTDGQPTDSWEQPADLLKKQKIANIIACAAGNSANELVLKRITESVIKLRDVSPDTFKAFFQWVSASISQSSASVNSSPKEGQGINLPAPPASAGFQIIP